MTNPRTDAIRERLKAAPAFTPYVHTYGSVVVMITCANKREAEALAEFLEHAREDIETLLDGAAAEIAQMALW